jgi:hypothetical protein
MGAQAGEEAVTGGEKEPRKVESEAGKDRGLKSLWVDEEIHEELRELAHRKRSSISGEASRLLRHAIQAEQSGQLDPEPSAE